jgi:hypothetical protein
VNGKRYGFAVHTNFMIISCIVLIGLGDASCSGEDSDGRQEDTGTGTLTRVDNAADVSRRAAADLGRDFGSGEEQSPRQRAGEIGYEYVGGGGGGEGGTRFKMFYANDSSVTCSRN